MVRSQQNIVIDEPLGKFRGHYAIRRYSKNTPYRVAVFSALSEEMKDSLALQKAEGDNVVITAGKTALLKNLHGNYSQSLFNQCRVGSGTTTPTSADADVETIVGSTHVVTNFTVSGLTATWEIYFTSAENTGTLANAVICTGSPGTLITHFLISPSVNHTSGDAVILTYNLTVA